MCQKECCQDKHVDLLLIDERGKKHYVLSNILVHSSMILHYIDVKNIFSVIVYKLLEQQSY